ncbi:unnamed protein product [Ilex paraguariensis]|uniref:Suppressor of forked domain-containing protein n=1 Tax=Ilex paraguariensis TaxID=185542 RepID=A0ABC8URX1_9AQUA
MAETGNVDSSDAPPHREEATITNGTEADQPMPDIQNPKSPSDSDSDSDSDFEDEAQQNLQIQTLESELSNNPLNYDAYVQYIKALRKQGDLEKLRKAREAMSELFPLSPEMWQEWAKDEASLSSRSEDFPAIEKLYERGVSDYLVGSDS